MTAPGTCVLPHHTEPERLRRALDGLHVCGGCRARMARQLDELPALDADLAGHAAAGTGSNGGSPSAELRLPMDDRAATTRLRIRGVLSSWTLLVAEERGMAVPQVDAQTLAGASTVDVLTRWLARHLDWLSAHPAVDDWAGELDELHRAAHSIAYPSGRRRRPVADCRLELWLVATRQPYACPGRLTVTMRPDDELPDAVCDTCGDTVSPRVYLTRAEKGSRLTAVQLSVLWSVPLKTVERWARDAGWPSDGGRPARYDADAAQATLTKLRPEGVTA